MAALNQWLVEGRKPFFPFLVLDLRIANAGYFTLNCVSDCRWKTKGKETRSRGNVEYCASGVVSVVLKCTHWAQCVALKKVSYWSGENVRHSFYVTPQRPFCFHMMCERSYIPRTIKLLSKAGLPPVWLIHPSIQYAHLSWLLFPRMTIKMQSCEGMLGGSSQFKINFIGQACVSCLHHNTLPNNQTAWF